MYTKTKEVAPELFERVKILDHGYMEFVEHWGSDERIVEAARMSTGKGFLGWQECECDTCNGSGKVAEPVKVWDRAPRVFSGIDNEEFGVAAGLSHREMRDIPCLTCNGKGRLRGDQALLRFLWSNKHACYDKDTEVLVKGRGFVRWSDVVESDELGQWDSVTDSLVYEKPLALTADPFTGKMYRVNHGGVDLLVTPGHKMLVQTKEWSENQMRWTGVWRLETVEALGHRSMVRYRKHAARKVANPVDLSRFPKHVNREALLKLIGFFLGDGFAHRPDRSSPNTIFFHLKKDRKIKYLRSICAQIGWGVTQNKQLEVYANGVGSLFREMFYNKDDEKTLPSFLMDLCQEDAEAVLDGLKNSDGSIKRGAWAYTTTSSDLAQAVQLLVLHAGGSASINDPVWKASEQKPLYRIMVLSRMLEPVINQGKCNTTWDDYNGFVYCANTRTGVLVVRRNGKIVLSGNTPFEMAGMTLVAQGPIMVFREWHRHRTQSYNEMSARYTPLPPLDYLPTVERCMVVVGKNRQAGLARSADELTHEKALEWLKLMSSYYELGESVYQYGLGIGIPKELARLAVTVGRYSRMMASTDLRNWLAFLTLRMDSAAQYEIRMYANQVGEYIKSLFPKTWELFVEGKK